MSLLEDTQLLALKKVLLPDDDYIVRMIHRWYSAKFATPLHLVPTLPTADVYQAYYEEHYESMDLHEREEARRNLTMTETERLAKIREEEMNAPGGTSDQAFAAFADAEAKRLASTAVPKEKPVRALPHPHKPKELPEATLPEAVAPPPDVTVKYVSEDFFEDLMDKLDNQGS